MSDASSPSPDQPTPTPVAPKSSFSLPRLLLLAVVLVAAAGAVYGVAYLQNQPPAPADPAVAFKPYLAEQTRYAKMADGYTDANGDLIADPPTDPAKFVKPDEITFTVVATDNPIEAEKVWKPFLEHLQKTTGVKKASYAMELFPTPPATKTEKKENEGGAEEQDGGPPPTPQSGTVEQQLEALKAGKLHVTAFNTGFVQAAVNTAGFVPLFCPAAADGKFAYEMEIIVPAGSPVKTPADLKGTKSLAFVAMSSNSGAKAPLVTLKDKFNMLPGRDYEFVVSGTHYRSIDGVAAGKYAAAPVANDLLGRHVDAGKVKPDQFRSIFTSDPFPPITFGVANNLDPKLRADVERAFETFNFEGNEVGKFYSSPKRVKFTRIDYKKDFAYVREIDEKLSKLFDGK
jgi:phosphonate transport system substrate-binding protein